MDKQGAHRTYNIPKRYKDQFHMVQSSAAAVVWIMDVDATKIGVGVKQTTLSGKYAKENLNIKQTTLSGRCKYWH